MWTTHEDGCAWAYNFVPMTIDIGDITLNLGITWKFKMIPTDGINRFLCLMLWVVCTMSEVDTHTNFGYHAQKLIVTFWV